ncbi:glycosyltransferase WbsX family protein [Flavobacterium silvaticum]|uniref:Lipopolysaccharide biosynthesis protein n=1 Tax=Flavobacterium silvaticum TaxID=1852020 RepID=A0A972JJK7_9FLAO|nr:glycoside hydrolase family 99-like domain-containing protein [Flavobacterium silvaticum]NMH29488.1 lipopolysaccharide biosynthesis protein [Flavobacterium silvaticum]
MNRARIIAYYLPQFHPVPENDEWWGKGFTEWTNVGKAKPLFKKHDQPKLPADLGYYDLRIPEVREEQARLAKSYGIEGFCYWHYWFGNGKRLLEKPFQEVLESGNPDFGFCLAWANVKWGGLAYGDLFKRLLIDQEYPGIDDYTAHFNELLPAFLDKRYLRIDNKPIFTVYNPAGLPDPKLFTDHWQKLAKANGLDGIYFIAYQHFGYPYSENGFDALTPPSPSHLFLRIKSTLKEKIVRKLTPYKWLQYKYRSFHLRDLYRHSQLVDASDYSDVPKDIKFFPSCVPNWDHTPRSGHKGQVIVEASPEHFYRNLQNCYRRIKDYKPDEQIIFIKAWNEWAEGNYLEPDQKTGFANLEQIRKFQDGLNNQDVPDKR